MDRFEVKNMEIIFKLLILTYLSSLALAKVSIRPEPSPEVGIMSGESKYYQCVSTSKLEKLIWINPNGQEIVSDPNNGIYTVYILKKNTIKLELKNPKKSDSGIYKCISKNEQNQETSSASFKLHVFNPTVLKATKESYQVNEGDSVRLECLVTSDKDATVEFMWMFGQQDLSQDSRYRIEVSRERSHNLQEIQTISRLEIRNVSKENDGNYVCSVDTTNRFISDSKELKLTVRVQYKPRFDEKTPKSIWVKEETVQQGGPLSVNISCIVHADPEAHISWFTLDKRPVDTTRQTGGVLAKIEGSSNLSTLMLTFRNVDEIRNPRSNSRIKYKCIAENSQGADSRIFEIKTGRIPDSPMVLSLDYKDGAIILELNETNVEPPIDIYRLEISDEAHLFNKSNSKDNTSYVIETALARGEHKVHVYARNPVGWSERPYSSYILSVVNHSNNLNINLKLISTILVISLIYNILLFNNK